MKIFLSYASEDKDIAEQTYFALVGAAHDVFFDRSDLPPGGDYNTRIREALQESDLCIFFISPDSVGESSYALTELKFAEQKWPHPKGCVLPVMARETHYDNIPNYLKAITVLETRGSVPAEIAQWVNKRAGDGRGMGPLRRLISRHPIPVTLASVLAAGLVFLSIGGGRIISGLFGTASEGVIANIELPAYVVLDSAWETKGEAQRRLVDLSHAGYTNSGFFWIPDFEYLSGAQLYQVYVGPFSKKTAAEQELCRHNNKLGVTTYGVKLSARPGREEFRCTP